MSKADIKQGKFLSFVLRHNPSEIGIELDDQGWVDIDLLLAALAQYERPLTRERLDWLVANNDKSRYAISECGRRIRASQGHSVEVDLGYVAAAPPEFLFHGTADRFLESIRSEGLTKRNRHHVHLSRDLETATAVGTRHGRVVVLEVHAKEMAADGYEFFVTPNRVWLTDNVAAKYLKFPSK